MSNFLSYSAITNTIYEYDSSIFFSLSIQKSTVKRVATGIIGTMSARPMLSLKTAVTKAKIKNIV